MGSPGGHERTLFEACTAGRDTLLPLHKYVKTCCMYIAEMYNKV